MSTESKWSDESIKEFFKKLFNEGFNEFVCANWEKFKESKLSKPEWEVITYVYHTEPKPNTISKSHSYWKHCVENKYPIHSVKRLSDGEIFSIGDEVTYFPVNKSSWVIDNFFIRDDNKMLARSRDNINCEYVDNNLSKSKLSLFTTLDLIQIFNGERFYYVDKLFRINYYWADSAWTPREDGLEFSTKAAAEEYVLWNKPCLSLSEVLTRYNCVGGKDNQFIECIKNLAKINLEK